jgi:hypothetical protein
MKTTQLTKKEIQELIKCYNENKELFDKLIATGFVGFACLKIIQLINK